MFDFHIHLARLPHQKQLTQLFCNGNYGFIAVACEPWEWKIVADLKKEFSTEQKPFKASYGIHPMIATQADDEMFAKLRSALEEDEIAMVGEAGIDKRYPGYDDGTQDQIFITQAKLALELQRDLQIHCVGDYQRVLKLLAEAGFPQETSQGQDAKGLQTLTRLQESPRPIFHRFGGDSSVVKKALPYGALFSLHEDSFQKKSTAKAIPLIPQERVFFETDADETFLQNNHPRHQSSLDGNDREYGECKGDSGTGSGMTSESAAGTTTPEEILTELENTLESVRAAYAKCRE